MPLPSPPSLAFRLLPATTGATSQFAVDVLSERAGRRGDGHMYGSDTNGEGEGEGEEVSECESVGVGGKDGVRL
ncbi:hypothetical protein SERLADRAFT_393548 [Serpula lacrymans var. lacrymans S7.9]|uniref:Uncharacterized protein n=1 Tax=Serpula lacrymans var. lacrymans (strain S7.9) TaxID=578457 RepID=F8P123_SERL9|nr:uncharacterized protein SERLADRAFT_393548 [Serpula lacrymans var. lacrymans S7.9]EGO22854.1 hypothetical protein SERLADRAFT_393548 [Serpula lacrymans var. lacrymans S7.9]